MSTITKTPIISRYSYLNSKLSLSQNAGKSSILAASHIPAGETVAVWGGMVRHKTELKDIDSKTLIHQLEDDIFLAIPVEEGVMESIHYIGTSEEPNCEFVSPITLRALREIQPGEEISYSVFQSRDIISSRQNKLNTRIESQPGFQDGAWGLLTSIDLEGCNPDLIRDAEAIRQYVYELCDLIEMKRFGDCHVVHFGEDERVAGYSMFQLIETSCISAHFANETNTSYLDIFSCKVYEPSVVAEFSKKYFQGENLRMTVTNRF